MHVSSNFQFYGFLSTKATMWVQKRLQPTVLPVRDARKVKNGVNKGKYVEALQTDLSKTFDCLSHELSIAKLWLGLSDTKTYSELPIKQKPKINLLFIIKPFFLLYQKAKTKI